MFKSIVQVWGYVKQKLVLPDQEIETRVECIINYCSSLGMLLVVPLIFKTNLRMEVSFADKLNILIMILSVLMALAGFVNLGYEKARLWFWAHKRKPSKVVNEGFARFIAWSGLAFVCYQALQYGFVVDCYMNPALRPSAPEPEWLVTGIYVFVLVSTFAVIFKALAVIHATSRR